MNWSGGRAAIRWMPNDEWSVTATANFQNLEADGFNDYDPDVGDLEVVKFANEFEPMIGCKPVSSLKVT